MNREVLNLRSISDRIVEARGAPRLGLLLLIVGGLFGILYVAAWILPINQDRILFDAIRAAVGVTAAVYCLGAIGLNVHFGYTGLLNFGHVAFLLVGAYGLAITVSVFGGPFWLGIIVGILASAALALLLGIPTLRLRADYLAIVTIAAAEILRFLFRARPLDPLTGSVFGLSGFAPRFYALNPIPEGSYGFWLFAYSHHRLWTLSVLWGLVIVISLLLYVLVNSPWGRVLKSIRDDEDAARSLGKNVFAYKMQSLVIGGVIGGLAGMMLVLHFQNAHPDWFLPLFTFFMYTLLILGGPATIAGPIVGAMAFWFLLQGLDSFLRQARAAGIISPDVFGTEEIGAIRFAAVGLALLLLMVFRPQGILGNKREMQLDV
jgi:neutral amino acid transport system permease protein